MLCCSGNLIDEHLFNEEIFPNQSPRSAIGVVDRAASFGATMDSLMKVVPDRSSVDAHHPQFSPKISRQSYTSRPPIPNLYCIETAHSIAHRRLRPVGLVIC